MSTNNTNNDDNGCNSNNSSYSSFGDINDEYALQRTEYIRHQSETILDLVTDNTTVATEGYDDDDVDDDNSYNHCSNNNKNDNHGNNDNHHNHHHCLHDNFHHQHHYPDENEENDPGGDDYDIVSSTSTKRQQQQQRLLVLPTATTTTTMAMAGATTCLVDADEAIKKKEAQFAPKQQHRPPSSKKESNFHITTTYTPSCPPHDDDDDAGNSKTDNMQKGQHHHHHHSNNKHYGQSTVAAATTLGSEGDITEAQDVTLGIGVEVGVQLSDIISTTTEDGDEDYLPPPLPPNLIERNSSMTFIPAPISSLTRSQRYQPPPGALHMPGILSTSSPNASANNNMNYDDNNDYDNENYNADEDDDDNYRENNLDYSEEYSITNQNNDVTTNNNNIGRNGSPRMAGVSNSNNLDLQIEAVLVDDTMDEEAALQREMELNERERLIRERELELERRLQQIEEAPVVNAVQAQVVSTATSDDDDDDDESPVAGGKKKKKGLFSGLFKRSLVGSGSSKNRKKKQTPRSSTSSSSSSPSSPLTSPRISSTSFASQNAHTELTATATVAAAATTTTTTLTTTAAVEGFRSSSSMFDFSNLSTPKSRQTAIERFSTIPIFRFGELCEGKEIGNGACNFVCLLQSINLDHLWLATHFGNGGGGGSTTPDTLVCFEPDIMEKQNKLRMDFANKFVNTIATNSTSASTRKAKRSYVIKTIQKGLTSRRHQEAAATQLIFESSLLFNLSHENIIPLSGASAETLLPTTKHKYKNNRNQQHQQSSPSSSFFDPQSYFTITEYLEDNLFDRLNTSWSRRVKGPEFFLERLEVATSLASVLSYLHSLNIIYFDLKPENIGFDKKGVLKLHNFGAAHELSLEQDCRYHQQQQQREQEQQVSSSSHDISTYSSASSCTCCFCSHPFVGTRPYVAPEAILKKPSGLSSDAYGFAIILWEIMTLKEPFEGLLISEYTRKVIQEQKRPKLGKKTPMEINDIISACWEHDPNQRPCMKDVYEQLLSYQEQYRGMTKRS